MNVREYDKEKEHKEYMQELETLILCYEAASPDDRAVVWAILNKYAPLVADL